MQEPLSTKDGVHERRTCGGAGGRAFHGGARVITEDHLEQLCLTWFQDSGWDFLYGPDIAPDGDTPERPDYRQTLLPGRVLEALQRLNPQVPQTVLDDVLHRLAKPEQLSLIQNNRAFHDLLRDGVQVEYDQDGEKRGDCVRLIEFTQPERNRFLVVNQFTVQGTRHTRRPDIVAFINGLPVAVIELKNLADEQTDIWTAFNQLQTYKAEIPDLFVFNEALVISDGLQARVGSLSADRERFMPWRTIRNENDKPRLEFELKKLVRGFFAPDLLLDYLQYFVLFEPAGDTLEKKIAGYHQFHAVRELGDMTLKKIALELTEKLRNNTSVDWQKRESVRARLRNLVRITLRRYKYPPDKQDAAIDLVLRQAEKLSEDWSTAL